MTQRPDCGTGQASTHAGGRNRRGLALAALAVSGGLAVAGPAQADGSFIQFDQSSKSTSGVLAVERGNLQFGLNRAEWNGGFHWTGRVTWKFPFTLGQVPMTLRVGPAVQYSHPSIWQGGLAVVAESYNTTPWGSLYLLSDLSTIDYSYFFMTQFNLKSGISLELAALGNNDNYHDRTVTLGYRFRDTPFSLRIGRKLHAHETYVGLSINTF